MSAAAGTGPSRSTAPRLQLDGGGHQHAVGHDHEWRLRERQRHGAYAFEANSGGTRTGTLTIAGHSFTLTQSSGCSLRSTRGSRPCQPPAALEQSTSPRRGLRVDGLQPAGMGARHVGCKRERSGRRPVRCRSEHRVGADVDHPHRHPAVRAHAGRRLHVRRLARHPGSRQRRVSRTAGRRGAVRMPMDGGEQRCVGHDYQRGDGFRQRPGRCRVCRQYRAGADRHADRRHPHGERQPGLGLHLHAERTGIQCAGDRSDGSVNVTAGAGCPWSATSQAPWILVAPGTAGAGDGTVPSPSTPMRRAPRGSAPSPSAARCSRYRSNKSHVLRATCTCDVLRNVLLHVNVLRAKFDVLNVDQLRLVGWPSGLGFAGD